VAQAAQPALVIVGGVNGCGKSTFAQRAAGTETLLYQAPINPDDLTLEAKKQAEARGFDLGRSGANLVALWRSRPSSWRSSASPRGSGSAGMGLKKQRFAHGGAEPTGTSFYLRGSSTM
jgi:hypothetical protein